MYLEANEVVSYSVISFVFGSLTVRSRDANWQQTTMRSAQQLMCVSVCRTMKIYIYVRIVEFGALSLESKGNKKWWHCSSGRKRRAHLWVRVAFTDTTEKIKKNK